MDWSWVISLLGCNALHHIRCAIPTCINTNTYAFMRQFYQDVPFHDNTKQRRAQTQVAPVQFSLTKTKNCKPFLWSSLCLLLQLIELTNRLNRSQFVYRQHFDFLNKRVPLGSEESHLPCGRHGHVFHGFAAGFGIPFVLELFKDFFGT